MRGAVLVADGDLSIRSLIAAVLQRLGLVPTPARDGETALALLRSGDFQLAVVDLRLPCASGGDFVTELRRALPEMLPRTVVVAAEPFPIAALAGVCAVVRKPFAIDELMAVARRCGSDSAL